MGWCSATVIFDSVVSGIVGDTEIDKKELIRIVANALEDGDWDCQQDSNYWDHQLVQEVMRELHPSWFKDEE